MAVTVFVLVRVIEHLFVETESHPLQPVKAEPASAAAVSTTCEPLANRAEQVAPQAIPPGALVTAPEPLPPRTTESTNDGKIVKFAAAVPPPGGGFTTVTGIVPADAISVAEIASCNCVGLTNVGVRGCPFHETVELGSKLFPLIVKVKAVPPASALLGENGEGESEGTGLRPQFHEGLSVVPKGGAGTGICWGVLFGAASTIQSPRFPQTATREPMSWPKANASCVPSPDQLRPHTRCWVV